MLTMLTIYPRTNTRKHPVPDVIEVDTRLMSALKLVGAFLFGAAVALGLLLLTGKAWG